MHQFKKIAFTFAAVSGLLTAPGSAQAAIMWGWSFQGEAGTFTTNGTVLGNAVAPGTYLLQDFAVTSSTSGTPLGSVLGGQYIPVLSMPYDFSWNGSAVTQWHTVSLPHYLYYVDSSDQHSFFFGWDGLTTNANGAEVTHESDEPSYGPVTVTALGSTVGAVPEPATWALLISGFGLIGGLMRRRRKALSRDSQTADFRNASHFAVPRRAR